MEAYTHFTSPIRRYPDLLVHRVIKAILNHTRYQLPDLPTPSEAYIKLSRKVSAQRDKTAVASAGKSTRKTNADVAAWQAVGLHCSANERRADEASRDVQAWLKCRYMRDHLGEEYTGVVSAVTGFGLFVTLDSVYIEGLIHITELGGEYYRFDEIRQELRGERTGIRYHLGSKVNVQVSRVDLDARRIDFRLVQELGARAAESPATANVLPRSKGKPPTLPAAKPAKKTSTRRGGVAASKPKSPKKPR
jgi:ribonuclease R